MGHGANDKLYITHAEHSGGLGEHSASAGYRQKAQAPHPGARVPFDSCAISLQPFSHPVCARSADGTGTVFDLLNIIPWLKEHKNTHPITKEPLLPASLLTLHYARNASTELHDPVTFKVFTPHSHIVAIATTGNVFLAESVKQFASSGKDLVSEVSFKKEDIITLQDPHNVGGTQIPIAPLAKTKPTTESNAASALASKEAAAKTAAAKVAAGQPYNISPYSTGQTGASLTSTAVAPRTETDVALFDEEELMYDEISRVKKEKDRARRRAYVRVVTNMGGSLNVELFCEKAPKTCYNFLMLARQGKYTNCPFHRLIPGFMVQGGDPTGTGRGGESYWGTPFRDEYDLKGAEKHTERGMLSMANKGMGTNGPCPHLDGKHTVFGKLVGGEEILTAIERAPLHAKSDLPLKPILITEVVIYQDPFEEYKQRLARKLQATSGATSSASHLVSGTGGNPGASAPTKQKQKHRDDVNWFGVKLGEEEAKTPAGGNVGVGKYLNLNTAGSGTGTKRSAPEPEEGKKKRKLGFGNFDAW